MNLKEFYKPLWVFGLVLIGLIVLINFLIAGNIGRPARPSVPSEKSLTNDQSSSVKNVQNSLSPDQPTRYDIVEQDERDRPQDSGQWDYMIKQTFQDAGLEDRVKQDNQYRSMVTTREDFQKRLAGVDSLIRTNEEKKEADPDNAVIQQQLDELNKLRAALLETEKYLVE